MVNQTAIENEQVQTYEPLYSIIIVTYNSGHMLSDTISSVLAQTCSDYEVIVKDAVSTDHSLQSVPEDPHIHIFSTKDNGIYDGMNEAIEYSHGKYLFFLNCGDLFESIDVLQNVKNYIDSAVNVADVIYGNIVSDGTIVKSPKQVSDSFFYRNTICHQAVFFNKKLFDTYGKYDTSFAISADYEFLLRVYKANAQYAKLECTVCDYLGGGVSETDSGIKKAKEERKRIIAQYYSFGKRLFYGTLLSLSMPELRRWISSTKSPKWLRECYKLLVNRCK